MCSYLSAGVVALLVLVDVSLAADKPVEIRSRLELMVDGHLINSLTGDARRVLHQPIAREIVINHDAPWEGSLSNYHTVFRDEDVYRMYYRGAQATFEDGKLKQPHAQVTCYAESRDGIHWEKPKLGLFEFEGSKENNIIWMRAPAMHNFAPFKDTRPDVPENEQYKALASSRNGKGLAAFASADGIRWRVLVEQPVITKGKFDSQNLAFWDGERMEYRGYWRDFRGGYRDIKTATSHDFITWSEGEWLEYPEAPRENLYTNQVVAYYRAPHLFIGLPTRYTDRKWTDSTRLLPELEHRELRAAASRRYGTAVTDLVLMSSRDGKTFERWNEAFLRPGPERPGTWNYGHLYTAWGLVETAPAIEGMPNELSIYGTESAWTGTDTLLRRYTTRIDGFASVHASQTGGELHTKPLTFTGKELLLNFATSGAGEIRVAILNEKDVPVPGFSITECHGVFGDELERRVSWVQGTDVSKLIGKTVHLRFVLKDADLYSFRFR